MKKLFTLLAFLLAAVLCFAGCNSVENCAELEGGVIRLKVNPEIVISYDAEGNVTAIEAGNEDAIAIIDGYTDYVGKPCKVVLSELVNAIGDAGYFTEELEGNGKKITIEIEDGSFLPSDAFIDEMTAEVLYVVEENEWVAPIEVDFDKKQESTADEIKGDKHHKHDKDDCDDKDDHHDDCDEDEIPETDEHIGVDAATEIALSNAGFAKEDVLKLKAKFDGDDNSAKYEVEFVKDGVEYEYDIDAVTGEIIKSEIDDENDCDEDDFDNDDRHHEGHKDHHDDDDCDDCDDDDDDDFDDDCDDDCDEDHD